ncbi:MAG: hypothetical protein CMO81_03465 [Waddliaceae bacterium]|nr:hypothetical protein [Waddliaceae bacterium]
MRKYQEQRLRRIFYCGVTFILLSITCLVLAVFIYTPSHFSEESLTQDLISLRKERFLTQEKRSNAFTFSALFFLMGTFCIASTKHKYPALPLR